MAIQSLINGQDTWLMEENEPGNTTSPMVWKEQRMLCPSSKPFKLAGGMELGPWEINTGCLHAMTAKAGKCHLLTWAFTALHGCPWWWVRVPQKKGKLLSSLCESHEHPCDCLWASMWCLSASMCCPGASIRIIPTSILVMATSIHVMAYEHPCDTQEHPTIWYLQASMWWSWVSSWCLRAHNRGISACFESQHTFLHTFTSGRRLWHLKQKSCC